MSNQKRISKAIAALLPGGALGASILLALTASGVAGARSSQTADPPPPTSISERLLAIRSAVSSMEAAAQASGSAEFGPDNSGRAEPTWWGNGGWGRWRLGWRNGGFGWPNWHNWHNWANGGWGNGGWNNGGWHNYWHNF